MAMGVEKWANTGNWLVESIGGVAIGDVKSVTGLRRDRGFSLNRSFANNADESTDDLRMVQMNRKQTVVLLSSSVDIFKSCKQLDARNYWFSPLADM